MVADGLFGKVVADLIAEGQSEPTVLQELHDHHRRRASTVEDVERGKATGEFPIDTDPHLLIDSMLGAIYYRFLLRFEPLTQHYGEEPVTQVLRGLGHEGMIVAE